MTKAELFSKLTATNKEERVIMDGCETFKDLKSNLQYYANMFYAIERQLNNTFQFYFGERYMYHAYDVKLMLDAIHNVAGKLNYELYSPNGAWFIKSKG